MPQLPTSVTTTAGRNKEVIKSPESLSMEYVCAGGSSSTAHNGEHINSLEDYHTKQQSIPSFGGVTQNYSQNSQINKGYQTKKSMDKHHRRPAQNITSNIDNYNSLISSSLGSGKMNGEGLSRQVVHQHDPRSMHHPYGNKQISRAGPSKIGPTGTTGPNSYKNMGFGNDDGINHVIQGDRILTM